MHRMISTSLIIFFHLLFELIVCQISTDGICSRLYVRINDDNPMKILDGVYTLRTNETVYFEHSTGSAFIFYDTNTNGEYINFGPHANGPNYWMYGVLKSSRLTWPYMIKGKLELPFENMIQSWNRYDPGISKNVYIGLESKVTIKCIEHYDNWKFQRCSNGEVYFNQTVTLPSGTKLSDPATIYFERFGGTYRNNRPVYKMVGTSELKQQYLFFETGYWVVNSQYRLFGAIFMCDTNDLLPEFTICNWTIFDENKNAYTQRGLSLQCRGSSGLCSTNNSPCSNGTCYDMTSNRSLCVCENSQTGESCSQDKGICPDPPENGNFPPNSNIIFGLRRLENDLIAYYCNNTGSYNSDFIFAHCTDSSPHHWELSGTCPYPTTSTPTKKATSPTTTKNSHVVSGNDKVEAKKPINFDDYPWLMPTIVSVASLLQIFMFFIARCAMKRWRDHREFIATMKTSRVKRELEQINIEFVNVPGNNRMKQDAEVKFVKKQAELQEAEIAEARLKQSHTMKWVAIISLVCFESCWLWTAYLVSCSFFKCAQYGEVFSVLVIMAFVVVPFCYVYMFLETFFCNEFQYLRKLGDVQDAVTIIEEMKQAVPYVSVTAEAYHYETRTRTVAYTDSNGYTQYRTETYQELVVTAFREEPFPFQYHIDLSEDNIKNVQHVGVTKIKIDLDISFGDEETGENFFAFYENFKEETKNLDTFVNHGVVKTIPNYTKRVATFLNRESVPFWMNTCVLVLFSLIGLTWIFRWMFKIKTFKTFFSIKKQIYVSRPQ